MNTKGVISCRFKLKEVSLPVVMQIGNDAGCTFRYLGVNATKLPLHDATVAMIIKIIMAATFS